MYSENFLAVKSQMLVQRLFNSFVSSPYTLAYFLTDTHIQKLNMEFYGIDGLYIAQTVSK